MASTVADKLGTGDGNGTRRRNRRDLSTRSEVSTGLRESAGGGRVRGRTTGGRNESAADGPSRGGAAVVSPACRPHRRPWERLKKLVRAGGGVSPKRVRATHRHPAKNRSTSVQPHRRHDADAGRE